MAYSSHCVLTLQFSEGYQDESQSAQYLKCCDSSNNKNNKNGDNCPCANNVNKKIFFILYKYNAIATSCIQSFFFFFMAQVNSVRVHLGDACNALFVL